MVSANHASDAAAPSEFFSHSDKDYDQRRAPLACLFGPWMLLDLASPHHTQPPLQAKQKAPAGRNNLTDSPRNTSTSTLSGDPRSEKNRGG